MASTNYVAKEWRSNDIVTADDFNRLEQGVEQTSERAAALESRAATIESNISSNDGDIAALQQRMTAVENKANANGTNISALQTRMTSVENKATANATDIETLRGQIEELTSKLTATESDIEDLQKDAVTKSSLKYDLAEHLVDDKTTSYSLVKGESTATLTMHFKNLNNTLIKYQYYRRSSSVNGSIGISVSINPDEKYSGFKYFVYTLCDVDTTKTNTMSESDIEKFISVVKTSGIGTYTTSFYKEGGQIKCKVGLLGGSIFSKVYVNLNISVVVRSDESYSIY